MPGSKNDSDKAGRLDGRKMTSIYLKPKIMNALKKRAIDEDRNAFEIVEDALVAYLKKPERS